MVSPLDQLADGASSGGGGGGTAKKAAAPVVVADSDTHRNKRVKGKQLPRAEENPAKKRRTADVVKSGEKDDVDDKAQEK